MDTLDKPTRSRVMANVRSTGNARTELELIRIFREWRITGWRRGQVLRVETGTKRVPIRPDFVFRGSRTVVFVDGEFWHGHPTLARIPATRRAWWAAKIEGNRRRDRMQNRALRAAGWTVIRIWQHELKTSACIRKLRRGGLLEK